MTPGSPGHEEDDRGGPSRTGLIAALVLLAVLGIAGYWLATALRHQGQIEDCVLARRGNCDALVK